MLIDSDTEIDLENEKLILAMVSPFEKADTQSDQDSDASDNLNEKLTHHLPRRLLNSKFCLNVFDKPLKIYQVHQQKNIKKIVKKWKKRFSLNNSIVQLSASVQAVSQAIIKTLKPPLNTFNSIFLPDLL